MRSLSNKSIHILILTNLILIRMKKVSIFRYSPLMYRNFTYSTINHRRKAHTEIVGFSIVAVCQMGVFARTPPSFGGRTSGIFYSKTKGEKHEVNTLGRIEKNQRQILCSD